MGKAKIKKPAKIAVTKKQDTDAHELGAPLKHKIAAPIDLSLSPPPESKKKLLKDNTPVDTTATDTTGGHVRVKPDDTGNSAAQAENTTSTPASDDIAASSRSGATTQTISRKAKKDDRTSDDDSARKQDRPEKKRDDDKNDDGSLNDDSLAFLLDPSNYRTIDGSGNNTVSKAPNGVDGGAVGAQYVRMTPAYYENGDGTTPRLSDPDPSRPGSFIADTGADALNPRDISNAVGAQGSQSILSAEGLNDLFWAYGQWIDHGLDLQPDGGPGRIAIPTPDDPNFPDIAITRTTPIDGTGTSGANPREYTNPLTAFEDASQIYGSQQWMTDLLRDPLTGKLLTAEAAEAQGFGPAPASNDGGDLMPTWGQFKAIALSRGYTIDQRDYGGGTYVDTGTISKDGQVYSVLAGGMIAAAFFGKNPGYSGAEAADDLFVSGDIRVNENSALSTLHTLFLREHNYQVDRLAKEYASEGIAVTDDQLFNAAKMIVEGEYQHIINREFLPAMLGDRFDAKAFDPSADPSITLEFATAAFRFGHSMLSDSIERLLADGSLAPDQLTLAEAFINPYELNNAAGDNMQGIIRGLHNKVAQNVDEMLVDVVRNGLLGAQDDLMARNIERGRDHGVGTLNEVRVALGLDAYKDWEDFADSMVNPQNVGKFIEAYGSVDNIDLYVGGLAEEHVHGGTLGETFSYIVGQQFANLHNGDQFYYLHRFESQLRSEIKDGTLQALFQRNFGVDIGSDAFHGNLPLGSGTLPDNVFGA